MSSDNKTVLKCLFVLGPFKPVLFFYLYSSVVNCQQTYLFIVHNLHHDFESIMTTFVTL